MSGNCVERLEGFKDFQFVARATGCRFEVGVRKVGASKTLCSGTPFPFCLHASDPSDLGGIRQPMSCIGGPRVVLECLGVVLGGCGVVLGHLGVVLGASWARLGQVGPKTWQSRLGLEPDLAKIAKSGWM